MQSSFQGAFFGRVGSASAHAPDGEVRVSGTIKFVSPESYNQSGLLSRE